MLPNTCIKIETAKFPIMDGEDDELVNEGMYGKALCLYLKSKLPEQGIQTGRIACEDWGWWIDVEGNGTKMGLCIYSDPEADGNPTTFAVLPSKSEGRTWSWKKLRKVEETASITSIMDSVFAILEADPEIDKVSRHDDFML